MTGDVAGSALPGRSDDVRQQDTELAALAARLEALRATVSEAAAAHALSLAELRSLAAAYALSLEEVRRTMNSGIYLDQASEQPVSSAPISTPDTVASSRKAAVDFGGTQTTVATFKLSAHVDFSLLTVVPLELTIDDLTLSATDADGTGADEFGIRLTEGFAEAVKAAIQDAHNQGLSVSAYEDGIAIEVLPDGTKVPIDETVEWSPLAWRTRNLG